MFTTKSRVWVKREIDAACIAARIKPHTWASLAIMNGMPLLLCSRNLGHANTKMVEKHYGHLSPSYEIDRPARGGDEMRGTAFSTFVHKLNFTCKSLRIVQQFNRR
jgi:hypothetical protein